MTRFIKIIYNTITYTARAGLRPGSGDIIFEAAAPHCCAAISGRRPVNHKHLIQSPIYRSRHGAIVLRFLNGGQEEQSGSSGGELWLKHSLGYPE